MCVAVGVPSETWPNSCSYFFNGSSAHLLIHDRARLHGVKSVQLWQASWCQRQGPLCRGCEVWIVSLTIVRLWSLTCDRGHPFSWQEDAPLGHCHPVLPCLCQGLVSDKYSGMRKLPIMSFLSCSLFKLVFKEVHELVGNMDMSDNLFLEKMNLTVVRSYSK